MTDQTSKSEQADKEWNELQRDLETLHEQFKSLGDHAGTLGETVLSNIELRFQDVLSRAHAYRNTTEAQIEELRQLAIGQADQAQATLKDTSVKSAEMARETARQMWERSEPLRQSAQELGHGFLRAWSEIAASFGKAAEKLQTEKTDNTTGKEGSEPS